MKKDFYTAYRNYIKINHSLIIVNPNSNQPNRTTEVKYLPFKQRKKNYHSRLLPYKLSCHKMGNN